MVVRSLSSLIEGTFLKSLLVVFEVKDRPSTSELYKFKI